MHTNPKHRPIGFSLNLVNLSKTRNEVSFVDGAARLIYLHSQESFNETFRFIYEISIRKLSLLSRMYVHKLWKGPF
jgi:hypothetical protein